MSAATPSGAIAFSYDEDFQGVVGAPDVSWSTTATTVAPADPSRRFLGEFGGTSTVFLTVVVPPHTSVSLAFDLYVIRSWDGSGTPYNDRFQVQVDGATEFNESFAQDWLTCCGRIQTFGPNPANPAGTGAVETNTLGFTWGGGGIPADTVYRIELLDLAHTSGTVTIALSGVNIGTGNDESWGIDNLAFTAC